MSKLTKREKRQKREAKAAKKLQQESALLSYLRNYGGEDGIQPAEEAAFDSQLKNLSLPVASKIAGNQEGTIFDIGCGSGILLNRLVEIEAFKSNVRWIYFGVDFPENTKKILVLAAELKVHRRVEAWALSDFYNAWPAPQQAPRPYIVVVRNVFHELNIDDTTRLLHFVVLNLDFNDHFIIQDLQVFPVSERGNACWLPEQFCELLKKLGLDATVVSEPTPKGNRWFTVDCKRSVKSDLQLSDVRSAVIVARTKQLNDWKRLGWLEQTMKSIAMSGWQSLISIFNVLRCRSNSLMLVRIRFKSRPRNNRRKSFKSRLQVDLRASRLETRDHPIWRYCRRTPSETELTTRTILRNSCSRINRSRSYLEVRWLVRRP